MTTTAVEKYIDSISKKFTHAETTEMGYRADLEVLLKEIFAALPGSRIAHDPKAQQGNKPDFIVFRDEVPILYVEAKDIGVSLDKVEKSEQATRYFGYANLVITDYTEFRFYRNGLAYGEPVKIAQYTSSDRSIKSFTDTYVNLVQTLIDFTKSFKEPIKSGTHLSKIMGGKARRIRDTVIHLFEVKSEDDADLRRLYETIKTLLVHDLTVHTFADMYAQTLVYGLFVARFNDDTPENFTRSESRELIPDSNPFLRSFFDHIVGIEFKSSLKYIVDELCVTFSHADIAKLLGDYYGTSKGVSDPVIHFYEDFLNEYDPELRKKMGAYYTPQPVVDFIVKSVDKLLREEFSLVDGLADTTKLPDGRHRVQVLDPATGTGTFISSIVDIVQDTVIRNNQGGRWFPYILNDLLPRIHGFELMMAPYTIAHLRLGIKFRKMGFWTFNRRRLGIYLTNTLEETDKSMFPTAFGLAQSIAEESKKAAVIKDSTPIMVVIGNPPYSGISSNETKYANSLVERYKVEPGGVTKLQERKHWLNDDYVKFIAFAESTVERTGYGMVAMITNNGYLDNPTFRGMRWHLAKTFDKICILDLHGNAKKKETAPDGSKDENVFDIMQGVAVIMAVKTGKKSPDQLSEVYHADLYGLRKHKFEELSKTPEWQRITLDNKMYYLLPKSTAGQVEYESGIDLAELFTVSNTGVCSQRDEIAINSSSEELKVVLADFLCLSEEEIRYKYGVRKDGRDWTVKTAKEDVICSGADPSLIKRIDYRPFDTRYTYFTGKSRGFIAYPRGGVFKHMRDGNFALLVNKVVKNNAGFHHIFVAKNIPDLHLFETANASIYASPLYLYSEDGSRVPNLSSTIVKEIEKIVGKVTAEDIFDYVYAVLHSPSYTRRNKEFLKTSFPRVPYPKDSDTFKRLVGMGQELRSLHLLESPKVNVFTTSYTVAGTDLVDAPVYKDGNVFINETQYFGNVPETAWSFYIGGYQPAQKWLKDRKGLVLTSQEIEHYQRIITVLEETCRIMQNLDGLV
jgi:hypothetical protein